MSRADGAGRPARLLPAALAGVLALAGAVLAPLPADAVSRNQVKQMVVEEALATRVPPALALAVAKVESDFQPRALSPKGARGVMQIMPRTAMDEYGVAADELWRLRLNIQLGIDFLERLIERYRGRWDLALSHYNAGTVAGRLPAARVLPAARGYVDAVLRWERRYRDQAEVWAAASPLPGSLQGPPGRAAEAADEAARSPAAAGVQVEWSPGPRTERVTWIPATPVRRARRPAPLPATAADGQLDDFDGTLEARRLRLRSTLDDFTSTVIWRDG